MLTLEQEDKNLPYVEITRELIQYLEENNLVMGCCEGANDDTFLNTYGRGALRAMDAGRLSIEKYAELIGKPLNESDMKMSNNISEKIFGGTKNFNDNDNNNTNNIRVKDASESYSEKRYDTAHTKTGKQVFDPIFQENCQTQSEAAKARAGVLFKNMARKAGISQIMLSDHEEGLLHDVKTKHPFCGKMGGEFYDYVAPGANQTKALIDSNTSGGLELVPIEFDRDVVTFPLLNGELFPLVDLVPVPRGRRIEGASISTPTMAWGGGDASTISLFDTTSMVDAIDTTIFTIDGAVEIGLDFLADSPVSVGSMITALVGQRLLAELDQMIVSGNGTTQPEGLSAASGVTTVSSDNGNGGPPTNNDFISLLFALEKQYRRKDLNVVFVSNDTTYQRSRQIAIDTASPTTDQRPALSPLSEINNYMTLGWNHKIQNDLANTWAAVVAMRKYRMYRRLGLEVKFVTGGATLARDNTALLVYRARYGGKIVDSSAMAKITDFQS